MLKAQQLLNESSGTNIALLTRDPIFIFQQVKVAIDEKEKEKFEGLVKNLREHLPSDFKIGAAVSEGDCFFDSVAQGLNELVDKCFITSDKKFNAKSLRRICKKCAQKELSVLRNDSWLDKSLNKENEKLHEYVPRIEFTAEDIKNASSDSEVKILKLENAIWGRPEIEGKMIADEYNVELCFYSINEEFGGKISVTKITVNSGDPEVFIEEENLEELRVDTKKFIGIVNYKKHFVPLLSSIKKDIENNVEVSREEVYGVIGKNSPSLIEDIRNYDLGENSCLNNNQAELPINKKGDGNCFFHAAFGSKTTDMYETEKAEDMRNEWSNFLNQFTSLNDIRMPERLREQLEKVFNIFLDNPEDLTGGSSAIKNLAEETKKKIEAVENAAKQLADRLAIGDNAVNSNLKEYALKNDPSLTEDEYDRKYNSEFVAKESFFRTEGLYKAYLGAVNNKNYFVFFEEIPVLASLADVKITVYRDNQNGPEIFEPNQELLGSYRPKREIWGQKKEVVICHQGMHFSYIDSLDKLNELINKESTRSMFQRQFKQSSSNNRQPKSGQKQKLQPGPSHQVGSLREQPSGLSENRKKRSNNGLSQPGILEIQQVSQELLSSDEEYYDASDKVERSSISCESDSDLESIPTVSHFKQRTWKDGKFGKADHSSFNENKGTRKSFGENGYIEGQWKNDHLIEIDSCQFTHPHNNKTVYIRKQSPGYLFTFDQENFIARVSFNKIEELDFAGHPIGIKRNFLEKLKITKIIEDELLNNRDKAYEQFKQFLQDRSGKTADNLEYAEDLFQFSKRLEDWRKFSSNISILDDVVNNQNISRETNSSSQQLLNRERALDIRKKEFSRVDQFYTRDLLTGLQQICKDGINNHGSILYDKYLWSISVMAPSVMVDHLSDLHDKSVFYISNKDMELFADLVDMMSEQPFLDLVGDSWNALFKRIKEMRGEALGKLASSQSFTPLTHPMYFYLCKSFQELILEISSKTDISVNDLLKKDGQGKWGLIQTINWPLTSSLNRSLEQQYHFIFTLMKYFEPGYYSDKKEFEYKLKSLQDPGDETWLQRIKNSVSNFFGNNELSSISSQERLAWIYIIDSAITNLLSEKELKLFEPLIQGYMDFIKNTEGDHYESFRIATHNVIRFIAQTSPYLSKEVSEIDRDILTKQIKSIKKAFLDEQSSDFRDLVDVYNEYWKNRKFILEKIPDKFPYGEFKQNMEAIRNTLLDIASTALDKKAKSQGFIKYFRSFNEFLEDLNSIEFSWFIKGTNNDLTEVEVANKDKNSYKVLDPENFIKKYKDNIPNHYLIEITQDLLNSVSNLLEQKKWSDDDNLSAASELLSAIKKSFLYLKEQPNYVSFDIFKEESTKPFISVVGNSISYEDFKKRIGIIGESFWYLRKQDEIDIDKALELYRKENNNSTVETLRDCYNRYLKEFNSYIQETSDKNYQDKIKFITEKVREQSKQIKIDEWNTKFKRETLPDLLAGLAAVWSIQESKDIASTGKSLKPHCIQILCILRLLSVDKDSKGVDKHLAQVLTGQGKSLVLGLLSSLLVLTGHKVRTVCYSEYLAARDQQDFNGFFKEFGIGDKITYGTFEKMANEVIKPEVNGKKQDLRELVKGRILNHSVEQSGQIKQEDISNTILLIDEVDVFFSDQFYGNTYGPCNTIHISGLASIQEKIWGMASKNYEKSTILKEVGERNQDFKEFNKFLFKPGKYYLLKEKDNVVIKKEYTNRSLYQEHLEEMIDAAIRVTKGSDKDWYINNYKINDKGIISYRRDDGFYSTLTYCSYYNVFNYFRLKKKDFDCKNYGYLNIDCGKVSYAELPKEYPLILGVSGTLTTLDEHEKKAVRKSYNIRENSIMPSFFGDSHLKFNSSENFTSQNSEEEWLSKIFNRANSKVGSGQSVLIFFDTDVEIRKFKEKFFGKFDRLHILTENTEEHTKEKYIDEAGIAKTVTLATRGMGRGVDFKSSVAVENSGGVHVIQTFFSLDIKEETQIKGRTARKDNKGSYELILCKEHLVNAGFLKEEEKEITINYESLNKSREQKVKEKGSKNEKRIRESESNHKTTMDFLESFFQKECSTNIDQPSVEPAVSRQQNR